MPRDEKKEKAESHKKQRKKGPKTKKSDYYSIKEGKLDRKKYCPKCGAGTFMAQHKDRYSCGYCGYTEWKTEK